MKLKDFLAEIKTGFCDFTVTVGDSGPDNYGTDDIHTGKYIGIDGGDIYHCASANDVKASLSDAMPADWLEREVIEVDAYNDMDELVKFFGREAYSEARPFINICIQAQEGDEKYWAEAELNTPIHTNLDTDYVKEILA